MDLPHSQTYFLSLLGAIGRRGNNRGPIGRRARGGGRKKKRGASPALALGRKWSYILEWHLASLFLVAYPVSRVVEPRSSVLPLFGL